MMTLIKYGLVISMIINAALLAVVVGIMPLLLYVSLIIHMAAFWYLKTLLNELNQYNKDIVALLETCEGLQAHIESIHEMEMFYGEPVLQQLIEHTHQVNDEIEYYMQKYLSEQLEEEEGELELVSTEEEAPQNPIAF